MYVLLCRFNSTGETRIGSVSFMATHQPFLIAAALRADVVLDGASHGLRHGLEAFVALDVHLVVTECYSGPVDFEGILDPVLEIVVLAFILFFFLDDASQLLSAVQQERLGYDFGGPVGGGLQRLADLAVQVGLRQLAFLLRLEQHFQLVGNLKLLLRQGLLVPARIVVDPANQVLVQVVLHALLEEQFAVARLAVAYCGVDGG